MKRVLISYANEKYKQAQDRLVDSARKYRYFDVIYRFGESDIDTEYRKKYDSIFSIERGNGLWLWKPYLINKVMNELKEGDLIFYCDSGAIFLKSPQFIEKFIDDIYVSDIPLVEWQFTKRSVLDSVNANNEVRNTNQIIATYFIIKKCRQTENLVEEWIKMCEETNFLLPSDGVNEKQGFISHREDQSLFSIVCKQNGVIPKADVTQRYYIPFSYCEKGYLYGKKTPKERGQKTILFLHKLEHPTFWNLCKAFLRQIKASIVNYTYYRKSKKEDKYS